MTGCHTALMRESGGKLVLTPTEAAYVDSLRTDDRPVVDLNGEMDPSKAARRTIEAMEAGADVIVQATFLEPEWHGRADILERGAHAEPFRGLVVSGHRHPALPLLRDAGKNPGLPPTIPSPLTSATPTPGSAFARPSAARMTTCHW